MAEPTTTPPPRWIIERMEFENFKSYAGKQGIGPFHKNFSAVCGPNGSGKSNVIDGLLFVSGASARVLRMSKASELIHSSAANPSMPFAKVTVHFARIQEANVRGSVPDTPDTDNEYTVIGRAVLSRKVDRDNKSTYNLDGTNKPWSELAAKLKSMGIDMSTNRFLILQGEVERISQMPPKGATEHDMGLLEYLESIIGSDSLIPQISEAANVLEDLNDNRGAVLARTKAAEREKAHLEGARSEAEEYMLKSCELLTKEHYIGQSKRSEFLDTQTELEESIQEINDALEAQRAALGLDKADSAAQVEAEFKKCDQAAEAARKALRKARDAYSAYERQAVKYSEDSKHVGSKLKKLQAVAAKEGAKAASASDALAGHESSLASVTEDLNARTQELADAEAALAKAVAAQSKKPGMAKVAKDLEAASAALAPAREEKARLTSAVSVARAEVEALTSAIEEAAAVLERAENDVARFEQELPVAEQACKAASAAVKQAKKDQTTAESDLEEGKKAEAKVNASLASIRAALGDVASAKEAEAAKGTVMSALGAGMRSGQLKGIIGRLGDLGEVEDKFDVAVSTAARALNFVVVESSAAASAAVKYLQQAKAGIATFIILTEMTKNYAKAAAADFDAPAGSHRLFDLIRPDREDLGPAFYYAFRNTLVAKDLDSAQAIAYPAGHSGRGGAAHRIVTLRGELIEASGTMSGGGAKAAQGLMRIVSKGKGRRMAHAAGSSVNETEFVQLQMQERQLVDQANALASAAGAAQKRLKAANQALSAAQLALKKATMDVQGVQAQLEDARAKATQAAQAAQAAASAVEASGQQAAETLETAESDLAAAIKASEEGEAQFSALQAKIDAGTAAERRKVNELKSTVEALEEKATYLSVQVKTATKEATRANKAAKSAQDEAEAVAKGAEKATSAANALDAESAKLKEGVDSATKELRTAESARSDAHAAWEELKAATATMRAAELEARRKSGGMMKRLDEVKWRLQGADKALEELQDKYRDYMEALEEGSGKEEDSDSNEADDANNAKWSMTMYDASEFKKEDSAELVRAASATVKGLRAALEGMRPNMGAIAEHRKKTAEWEGRVKELDVITEKRDAARGEWERLRQERLTAFMEGFGEITTKLKEMYRLITLGGDAELELVDSLDPFSEGIVFSVRPPAKSWKNISNLSGGEKTLSSLALVFALHHFKPTPFYVMDEIDAALDFKNVSIVANYIKERTSNAQFIIISLRNNMFELSDRLVGIYKTNDATKSVTIHPGKLSVGMKPRKASAEPLSELVEDENAPAMPSAPLGRSRRRVVS